jgi:hypothetical protein
MVVDWTATLRDADPAQEVPDAKLVVHQRAGPEGRWFADLLATGQHGPVAGLTPLAELDAPPEVRAADLRARWP